jgi:hypothetical protein
LKTSLNSFILTGLLIIAPGYNNTIARAQPQETRTSQKQLVKDELYFGLSRKRGKTISELEWQLFLSRVVTPRFKEGLTVIDGYGQYLDSSGLINREKAKIVILIYENNRQKNQMVEEVITSYKRMFQQESVLRVTSNVKVSF